MYREIFIHFLKLKEIFYRLFNLYDFMFFVSSGFLIFRRELCFFFADLLYFFEAYFISEYKLENLQNNFEVGLFLYLKAHVEQCIGKNLDRSLAAEVLHAALVKIKLKDCVICLELLLGLVLLFLKFFKK